MGTNAYYRKYEPILIKHTFRPDFTNNVKGINYLPRHSVHIIHAYTNGLITLLCKDYLSKKSSTY